MNLNKQKIIQAGKIASEAKKYARTIAKKGTPLLDIAEKIEAKIEELGGKPAFPVNLSIDEVAAHYTPSHDDKTLAQGLLKIDIGVHIDGWVADTALSVDLENNEENKRLILVSELALKNASKIIKLNVKNSEIGKIIEESISSGEISPVINLSGHGIEHYELHSGITIPNIDNHQQIPLKEGLYAIEPFTTNGSGKVYDGRDSGIYELVSERNIRSQSARELLNFIIKEYNKLPFCSRWIVKKLGANALLSLRQLKANGNLHEFSMLMESGHGKVAQAENTFLIEKDKVTITTD
ncbi:MAG: type II methionyl aminopeptidase [Candidatus Pacearchaeota archaeon]